MAKIMLKNEGIEIEVPDGARILDYLKGTNLPFGCERGECGVCVCSVSRGVENVGKRNQKEEETLNRIGAYPSQRLACQLVIKKGEIELEY